MGDYPPEFSAVMNTAARPDTVFLSGRGSWLTDQDNKSYLDFVQGWAVNCLGHCSPAVMGALILQSSRLVNCSPGYFNAPMGELTRKLAALSGLEKVFLCSTGAEANEGAIKLARKWGAKHRGGAHIIITMQQAFHGRTLAAMSASDKPGWDALFAPKVSGFRRVALNDLEAVAAAIDESVVAVMLEPIQGESGVWPATTAFLKGLRALTQRRGLLLILDEVQTGIGRTGRMFDFEHAGITPDIMTLGKGLGGGVPLAALLARAEVSCFEPGDQGGTYTFNALMAAVGNAVLREITKPGFLDAVVAKSALLERELATLSRRHGLGAVRGRGLLLALDVGDGRAPEIAERARAAGLLLNAPRPDCLRFMPALTVTDAEIREMARILDGVLTTAR